MKTLNITFTDEEYEILDMEKKKVEAQSWRAFFLILIKPKGEN